jgi:hypothetical protein
VTEADVRGGVVEMCRDSTVIRWECRD